MKNNLEKGLKNLFSEGSESVHVLADFDGTLTKEYIGGKKTPSLISILRDNPEYLSEEYREKAHALFAKHHPIEKDSSIPMEERKKNMIEWWENHKKLLIDSGIRKDHLEMLADSDIIQWRQGAVEFLKKMKNAGIPVVILSASGIGEVIPMYCENKGVSFDQMHFLVNQFIWNQDGQAIDFKKPIIHSLNKDETIVKDYVDVYQEVRNRLNVLLLGNNLGDLRMIDGFDAKNIFSIGFLDKEEKAKASEYSSNFDQVIVGDGYSEINRILDKII
ncbi:hypothetical protein GF376_02805 [Candidatus Peregrinibacteria bacterium]|nr:hypothetical protein [Candidatus Peregrinibacteria bacterium]